MKKNVLFINPDAYSHYKSKIKVAVSKVPPLTIATLAANLLNHNIKIIDMALLPGYESLIENLKKFKPDYICITSSTPTFTEAEELIKISRKYTDAKIILGGSHVSSFPEISLEESKADIIVKGEGDITLKRIIEERELSKINGICYKKNGEIIRTPDQPYIQDLDSLPYPAWHLFDIKKYKCSRLVSKKSPLGSIETSRGCVYGCIYCNKSIFGKTFRTKSPERVVKEIKYMLKLGFKEIQITDDGFSTNLTRGKKICKLIIKEKLNFPWVLSNGIRIDRVDEELIKLLKESGCYRIAYGIESGSQKVLDRINKGIKLENIKKVVDLTKKHGIETQGFFMLGLPGDTEKTMQQTIDLAKSLNLDTCKATITVPFPGSPLYKELNEAGAINTNDWSLFSQHSPGKIYRHTDLDWETIRKYYSKFYKGTLYSPSFIFKRIKNGLLNGQVFWDAYYFLKSLGKPL